MHPSLWSVLAFNAVPAIGVLAFDWSIALVLLLYWLDNTVGGALWLRAIRRHEAATAAGGHYRAHFGVRSGEAPVGHFVDEYRTFAVWFNGGHGVMLLALALLLLDGAALLSQLPWVLLLALAAVAGHAAELRATQHELERRSFRWLLGQVRTSTRGILAMHLGVVLGGLSLAIDDSGRLLALLFIGLRTAVELQRVAQADMLDALPLRTRGQPTGDDDDERPATRSANVPQ